MTKYRAIGLLAAVAIAGGAMATDVSVTLPAGGSAPFDGRMILIVSPQADPEPRLQVQLEAPLKTPYIFGQTVDGAAPGARVALTSTYGWPVQLAALPAGDYTVQAVFNRYETFHRADGSTVKLPPTWARASIGTEKPAIPIRRRCACISGRKRHRCR